MNALASHQPLTDAPNHRDDDVVARLHKSEAFRDYQQAFQTATGLPLTLRAAGDFSAPLTGARNINAFCALMASCSKTCAACLQMQQRVETEAIQEPRTLQCFAGLYDSMVPIRLGEKVLAYLQTGQVLFRAPTETQFRAALKKIRELSDEVDVTALHVAFFKTRVQSKPTYEAALRLLASFAQHLSRVANELMIQSAAAEPPAVTKARAFIAQHGADDLSLAQVARAAGMSTFYFCKVFKAAVGLTFSDYVARTRVEKTKQLLLDPNMRVSEAAFAAGFQSLSQFNRVFRRITGESPTHYRDALHASTGRSSLAFAA